MRTIISRCLLVVAAVIAITLAQGFHRHPAIAQSQTSPNSEPWLDKAVAEGHCPLTPVNLPPGFQPNADVLRKRVRVVDDTLQIRGTRNPDQSSSSPVGRRALYASGSTAFIWEPSARSRASTFGVAAALTSSS